MVLSRRPPAATPRGARSKPVDITQALVDLGGEACYNQLRQQIMSLTECSKRTAQLAISEAGQQGWLLDDDRHYHSPA